MNKANTLTPDVIHIVKDHGTEQANTGKYNTFDGKGTYLCRQCGVALFRSTNKFLASCGWPSFDDELPNTIKRLRDQDGRRTEIRCQRCDAHLGHVFTGEHYTDKNQRHCVNSLAIDFVNDANVVDTEEAMYAGGCFWGIEHLLKQEDGVHFTEVGYTGGAIDTPTYEQVCGKETGHLEATRVIYDPRRIDYDTITKVFLEIHDPTQTNGQGLDIGPQYRSAIFYYNDRQKNIAKKLITILENKGLNIATQLIPASVFWPAEAYHQAYYQKNGKEPYCHIRTKRF